MIHEAGAIGIVRSAMILVNCRKGAVVAAFAVALLVTAGVAASRQEKAGEKTLPQRPGQAEMERLKFYLGEWEYTETYPKSATDPNGPANTGIYTSKLGPGGNSLINTFHSQGPVGDFEGLLILTWDPGEGAYKAYAFGNDFPGALVETGGFEGNDLVFHSEMKVGARTMKLRNVTRLTAAGTIESYEYASAKEGEEKLFVKVIAKKKP